MANLRVFTDVPLDPAMLEALSTGIAPHELVRGGGSLEGADIAFGQVGTRAILESPSLKWVQVSSAGITRYDTPEFRSEARARGLILTNSSSVFDEPCAEHAFTFLMAQARNLPTSLRSRIPHGSDELFRLRGTYRSPRGQSMVILGYGAIARHLVRMLAPFEMKISAFRRQARGDEEVPIVTMEQLPAALAEADHVMNLLPANAESEKFIDAARLAQMKAGAVFYNIGRGTTVDQEALAEALRGGRPRAAWLDVTEPEPLPEGHPLLALDNCYITPHSAGGHENEGLALVRHFLENFAKFQAGAPVADRVL
jgi:phosphoglycerate dehydrogenase-like enzyme